MNARTTAHRAICRVGIAVLVGLVAIGGLTTLAAEPKGGSATGEPLTIDVLPAPTTEAAYSAPPADAASLQCQVKRAMPLPLSAVTFSPDGKTLAVGGLGEVVLWDLAEGRLAKRIDVGQTAAMVQVIAWTKDGGTLVAGQGSPGESGAVALIDVKAGKLAGELTDPKGPVNCLALSPDGKRLVAGCGDAAAYVWSLGDKKLLATLKDHSLPILSTAFGADGKFIVTGGTDAMVQTWNTETWKPDASRTMVGGEVRNCAIRKSQGTEAKVSHSFALLIGGREDRSVRFALDGKAQWWQRKAEYSLRIEPGVPLDCVWPSKDRQTVFIACSDGTIKVVNEASSKFTHVATLRGHSDYVYGLSLSADGARLASASGDGAVKLWSAADNRLLATFVQLSPRSNDWVIVTGDGWFSTSSPDAVTWKTANLKAAPEKLGALKSPDAVRQTLSGKPPAAPSFQQ